MVPKQGELFERDETTHRKDEASLPQSRAASDSDSQPAPEKVLTLVDASGLIFRAYHALPPLSTSKGVPTNAALGFARMVLKLLRERNPSYVALCFDKDSRQGRLAIDPNYKANREAPPGDLVAQFELIRRVADVLNLPIVEAAGWEADDVIATLARRAQFEGFRIEIITSDKDFLQLLSPMVSIFDPLKGKPITEADARDRFGVTAAQLRDYQALVGDAVDNIPKVPGIGPKTAAELLKQFGSVEALLSRLDEVSKPKTRLALSENRDQLLRAQNLVSFRSELDLPIEPEGLARKPIHEAQARALFTELEFFRLIDEMPAAAPTPLRQEAIEVVEAAALDAVARAIEQASVVGLAPAFEGQPHSARLYGLGVWAGGQCFFIDVEALTEMAVRQALGPSLRREARKIAAHDGKSLLHLLASLGIDGVAVATDVELLSYLLNPTRRAHALQDLARERLHVELPPWPQASDGRGPQALRDIPRSTRARIFGAAADAVQRLAGPLWAEIEAMGMAPLARSLELPLIPVLTQMERAGIRVDLRALEEVARSVDESCETLLENVYRHAGRVFNVGSPPQLAQILFEELKLPVLKKGKTGPSTDHEVLEKLAEEHPLPLTIMEYRNVAKLKSTYLDTLPGLVGADGRVRTTFHQAQTATGRLSSSNPNLQNIPIRTQLGQRIRGAFVAQEGWVLVSADYSQVELRILAHISEDEGLIKAFSEDADVHARTAAEVFGVEVGAVSDEQRRAAKMVNYGIAYGLSAHGLSTRLQISLAEAKGIIERYFDRFPGIAGYVKTTVERAKTRGYVESLFGRRRYMADLASRNRAVAMAAERAAINMPIQGTAADIAKRAMLHMDSRLCEGGFRAKMLLQVHDELLFEAPPDEAPKLAQLAQTVMSEVAVLRVPLVVSVGIGHSWAQAH